MPQVLKEEIYERIFHAGIEVFYEKDFRSAKMKDVAERAGIPVSLIYSYYKNKEALFEKIAGSASFDFERIAKKEEGVSGTPSQRYKSVTEGHLLDMLENHEILVILMDKSGGTKYETAKDDFVKSLQVHIEKELEKRRPGAYHHILIHILANNFAESILEVARHYQSRKAAKELLELVTKCYYEGVDSL